MGLESVTYIKDLNELWPLGTDPKSAGDDHIRRIKLALKNTFPNADSAISATPTELNALIGVTSNVQSQINAIATPANIALGALTPAADQVPYFTGASSAATATVTSFARTLLDDANQAAALTTLGAPLNTTTNLTGAHTVVAADRGKHFNASGTFTISLTAAATLGNGFAFAVRNTGTGTITIDPNAAELIDGAATIILTAGESCLVVCDGTAFNTVGMNTNGSITAQKLSGGQTGLAPAYACRAWVNFNGTGTAAIRASGNVSSITDNGVGDYTINFITAMPDVNYVFVGMSTGWSVYPDSTVGIVSRRVDSPPQTTSFRVLCGRGGTSSTVPADSDTICIAVFR